MTRHLDRDTARRFPRPRTIMKANAPKRTTPTNLHRRSPKHPTTGAMTRAMTPTSKVTTRIRHPCRYPHPLEPVDQVTVAGTAVVTAAAAVTEPTAQPS